MRGRMKDNIITLARLTQRGLKIFLKDRMGVFFALLAPLIVLLLYVLFLGDIQVDTVKNAFQGFPVDDKLVGNFVDAWMLAGVMSVACITVSFSAQTIMVSDRENNTLSDMLASPVPRSLVSVGYLVANIAITLVICLIVECVAFVYMAASGWTLSVGDTFLIVAHTVLSVISSSTLSTLICSGIKTASQHGAFVGILSAVIGFLVGAYMPLSVFPKGVQYITLFIPGTYSAGVYRPIPQGCTATSSCAARSRTSRRCSPRERRGSGIPSAWTSTFSAQKSASTPRHGFCADSSRSHFLSG